MGNNIAKPDFKQIIEAALLTASTPLSVKCLSELFAGDLSTAVIDKYLREIQTEYANRAVELVLLANGWRFKSRSEYMPFLAKLYPERAPNYHRAVLEILAIIAYKQPVTRGDIEAIRGVSVATQTMRTLEERGWIQIVGRREVVGYPSLWATTKQFLDDFALRTLSELPILEMQEKLASELANELAIDLPA